MKLHSRTHNFTPDKFKELSFSSNYRATKLSLVSAENYALYLFTFSISINEAIHSYSNENKLTAVNLLIVLPPIVENISTFVSLLISFVVCSHPLREKLPSIPCFLSVNLSLLVVFEQQDSPARGDRGGQPRLRRRPPRPRRRPRDHERRRIPATLVRTQNIQRLWRRQHRRKARRQGSFAIRGE